MSYVTRDGREYLDGGGFGADVSFPSSAEELQKLLNEAAQKGAMTTVCKTSPALCPQDPSATAIAKQLRDAANAQIDQYLKNLPEVGPVIAEALRGCRDPGDVVNRAKQLLGNITGDSAQKAAFTMAYAQARAGLTILDPVTSAYPWAKAAQNIVKTGVGMYEDGKAWLEKVAEKGEVDASGIADAAHIVSKSISAIRGIVAEVVGEGTATDVLDWVNVGVGCAGSIGSGAATAGVPGAAVGAVGCAISILSTVFTKYYRPTYPPPAAYIPLGRYNVPNQQLVSVIATDVTRLAAVLKYHYGVQSYAQLYGVLEALCQKGQGITDCHESTLTNLYPPKGVYEVGAAPIPGYTPRALLRVLHQLPMVTRDAAGGLTQVPQAASSSFGGDWVWESGTVGSLSELCKLANPQDNEQLDTMIFGDIPVSRIMERAANLKAGAGEAPGEAQEVEDPVADLGDIRTYFGYVHYHELLSYFAAVTLFEKEYAPGALTPWKQGPVPVQLWAVGEYNDEGGVRGRNSNTRYPADRWTMWGWYGAKRTTMFEGANELGHQLSLPYLFEDGIMKKDKWAIFELAGMRLLAAFSHMHMLYKWGDPETQSPIESLRGGKDIIADLPTLNPSDPARILRVPVDPKWYWKTGTDPFNSANWTRPDYTYMRSAAAARGAAFAPYMDQARKWALEDHKTVVNSFLKKTEELIASGWAEKSMVAGGAVSATGVQQAQAGIKAMAASGQLQMVSAATQIQNIQWRLSQGIPVSSYELDWLKAQGVTPQGTASGGAAAVAGLGLLALLLLRR